MDSKGSIFRNIIIICKTSVMSLISCSKSSSFVSKGLNDSFVCLQTIVFYTSLIIGIQASHILLGNLHFDLVGWERSPRLGFDSLITQLILEIHLLSSLSGLLFSFDQFLIPCPPTYYLAQWGSWVSPNCHPKDMLKFSEILSAVIWLGLHGQRVRICNKIRGLCFRRLGFVSLTRNLLVTYCKLPIITSCNISGIFVRDDHPYYWHRGINNLRIKYIIIRVSSSSLIGLKFWAFFSGTKLSPPDAGYHLFNMNFLHITVLSSLLNRHNLLSFVCCRYLLNIAM